MFEPTRVNFDPLSVCDSFEVANARRERESAARRRRAEAVARRVKSTTAFVALRRTLRKRT